MHNDAALQVWFIFNLHKRISFIFTRSQLIDIYTNYRQSLLNPLQIIKNPNLLGRPVSCSWWKIPIHSGPLPGSYCPTLWLLPLSPLPHPLSPHYTTNNDRWHQQSRSSSSGTVIFKNFLFNSIESENNSIFLSLSVFQQTWNQITFWVFIRLLNICIERKKCRIIITCSNFSWSQKRPQDGSEKKI
jgi:hypothetical protein